MNIVVWKLHPSMFQLSNTMTEVVYLSDILIEKKNTCSFFSYVANFLIVQYEKVH